MTEDRCTHDIVDKECAVADGYCPLCMVKELGRLRDDLEHYERRQRQVAADPALPQERDPRDATIATLRSDLAAQDESHQAWMTMAKEHIEQSVQGERELRATIATLDDALEPLTYMDCESWGCVHDEEPCAIEQAKKARARVGDLGVR